MSLRCTTSWFDINIHCKMIATISSVKVHTSHSYTVLSYFENFEDCLSNLQAQCRSVNYIYFTVHDIPRRRKLDSLWPECVNLSHWGNVWLWISKLKNRRKVPRMLHYLKVSPQHCQVALGNREQCWWDLRGGFEFPSDLFPTLHPRA